MPRMTCCARRPSRRTASSAFALLLALASCRGEPAPSGPYALQCDAAPVDPKRAQSGATEQLELTGTLWARSLGLAEQVTLAVAMDTASDALDLLLFGGEDLLDEPPETTLGRALGSIGAALPAARALAAAHLGQVADGRSTQLVAACPAALEPSCRCLDLRTPQARADSQIRLALWPLTDGAVVLPSQDARLPRVVACVEDALAQPQGGIGAVWHVATMVEGGQRAEGLTRAAVRLERIARTRAGKLREAAPLLAGIAHEAWAAPAWLRGREREVWVVPRLGDLAANTVGVTMRRCLRGAGVE